MIFLMHDLHVFIREAEAANDFNRVVNLQEEQRILRQRGDMLITEIMGAIKAVAASERVASSRRAREAYVFTVLTGWTLDRSMNYFVLDS